MKIKRIHIDHFGKLNDFDLEFTDGFQVLYGNNEDGKSTVMAFIKMMFYGSAGKSSDLNKNIRKKYMPWDGSKMSGSIEFECGGTVYRAERLFGASNATDKISLWNQATGEKEKIASGADLGQRFLGMGDTAFEKSVFIGQAGSMAGADKDDEITQKLLNLVSTGDESVSQKKVDTRLQSAKEQLKSKSGKIGILDKQYQHLNSLAEERAQALREEEEKKQMESRRAQLAEKKEALEKEYQQYKSQADLQEKLQQLQNLEKLLLKKQEIDKELLDCDQREKQLAKGDSSFAPDTFISGGEEQIARIKSLNAIFTERSRNVQALESEEASTQEPEAEIPPEQIDQIIEQGKEQASLQKAIAVLKETVQNLSQSEKLRSEYEQEIKRFTVQKEENHNLEASLQNAAAEYERTRDTAGLLKEESEKSKQRLNFLKQEQENANTQYQVALHNLKSVQQFSGQKIEAAEERLKQAGTPKQVIVKQKVARKNVPLLAAAAVLFIFSVLLGVFVHPACYAGAGIAVVLLIPAFSGKQEKEVATTVVDEAETASAQAALDEVRRAASLETDAAMRAVNDAENKLRELQEQTRQMQKNAEEAERTLQTALDERSLAEQKRNELEIKLRLSGERLSELTNNVKEKQAGLPKKDEVPFDLQSLQEQFETKSAYERALAGQIQSQLERVGCKTLEELQNRQIEQRSRLAKRTAKIENLTNAKADAAKAKENLREGIQNLIAYVGKYIPVSTFEEAVNTLRQFKEERQAIHTARMKAGSRLDYLNEEMQGRTPEQLQRESEEIRRGILGLNNGSLPEKLDDYEAENLKQKSLGTLEQFQKASEEVVRLSSEIKNRFAGRKSVSELENEVERLKREIAENEDSFTCLDIAQKTMTEAFNEIRQSFGPILNEKTAAIFHKLTCGKYHNVIISRNFDIHVQDAQSAVSHEWQYLSSGTVDQAYLALRLAVAELLSQNGEKLPLFLDDVFLQYDDSRAEDGLRFLSEYSKQNGVSQMVLFTCHQSILSFVKGMGLGAELNTF